MNRPALRRKRGTRRFWKWPKPLPSTAILGELFHELAERLHRVVEFDYLNLILHDPVRNVMRLHILESEKSKKQVPGTEFQIGETPSGWVWETQQPFILDDIEKETRYPELLQTLRRKWSEIALRAGR